MDNEKYGIELELIVNKFNEKIQKIKTAFTTIKKPKVELDVNTARINYLKSQIEEINYLLKQADRGFEVGDTLKLELKLARLNKQYEELIKTQNRLNISATNANTGISRGLDRMTSKIRRFGLSLLGVRSIFVLLNKASSAYLSQDIELANRIQSIWAGLGSILAPIIERIVDLVGKAIKYIAIFIKALTGVDLLARATAKSMNGTAKSAKALNKALAGFDELTNLDTEAGGSDGIGAGLAGLADIEINTEWADKLQRFAEWIKNNIGLVLAGLGGIVGFVKTLLPLIEKFGLLIGTIKALGIGLGIAGIVYAISSLINYLKNPTFQNFGKIIQGIGIAVIGLGLAFLSLPVTIAGAVVLIIGTIIRFWDNIKEFFQNGIDWLRDKSDWIHNIFGDTIGSIYDFFVNTLQNGLNFFDGIIKSIKGQFDGIIQFIQGVFAEDWDKAWDGIKKATMAWWDGIKSMFKTGVIDMGKAVGDLIANSLKLVVNKMLQKIESTLNNPIRAINRLIDTVNFVTSSNIPMLSTFSLPRLDVGTNYVPEDQIAMIHKGEAVVPKKFNSREYFGGANEETNAKLNDLIEAVRQIEINPYTTIKDVGSASLNYINNKSRQLGESVVV